MHLLIAALLAWNSWHTSAIVQDHGYPVFTVDGKPFFVYGAAFFYERIPRNKWRADLEAYKSLGINTIDLYVMWNWHEPDPGVVDFDGHTNPRRDLDGLLKTVHELGYKVILRPGPVIRNEWRNGGYPSWLLERAEYDMPLHDVLEGRYPATATFQNRHADAAAAQWLHNATHLREAARWLTAVLREVAPWSHDVIGIALDDDQGAYLDNDTWPAPHWHRYIDWLATVVRRNAGSKVPLFINTWQMKVTASAPVWAWGNWYQSDTYSIGDHDIDQLAFSTGLLQTQSEKPVMVSEFQAGWLQGADQVAPRAADPSNTTIALHELLQYGAHGVVNFPVQDTVNPAGWEAPWANHVYAWDAAIGLDGPTPRYDPTQDFGRLVTRVPQLASMHVVSDVDVAWLTSAYDPLFATDANVAKIADATIAQLTLCRSLALTCRLLDLRFASKQDIASVRRLVLPPSGIPNPYTSAVERRLASLRARHVPIANSVARFSTVRRANGGVADAALLLDSATGTALYDMFNASGQPRTIAAVELRVGARNVTIPAINVPARGGADFVIPPKGAAAPILTPKLAPPTIVMHVGARLHRDTGRVILLAEDFFGDGTPTFVLQNDAVRAVVSADAGARSFEFDDLPEADAYVGNPASLNAFTSIGAARDDVANPLAASPRDYIAQYTHPFPAGTFNRPYDCHILDAGPVHAQLRCSYVAPDLEESPVRFEKTFELDANSRTLTLETSASVDAVSLSAVTKQPLLTVDCLGCQIAHANGYRLVRVDLKAREPQTIRFTLKGPPATGPNRP